MRTSSDPAIPLRTGGPAVPPRREVGFSRFRMPLMLWVAAHRAVTLHQALYRFWLLDGQSPSHGYRVVRGLVGDGLLESRPLHPHLGPASRRVLTPSRAGWRAVGQRPRAWPIHRLDDVLQFAHVCLFREAEGWSVEPPARAWPLIRRRALDILRRTPRGLEMEQEARRRIEVMRLGDLGLWALHHPATGQVRLILNLRSFASAVRACERLVGIRLVTAAAPLELELTGGDPEQLEVARSRLVRGFDPQESRGARRATLRRSLPPLPLMVHVQPDFRSLPHPSTAVVPTRSVYAEHGVASPLTLRTAAPWMATRAGGVV